MTLDRRTFLGAAGALALPALLSGCGFVGSSSGSSPATGGQSTQTLTFTTWGTDAELAGFRSAIDGFQKANSGVSVALNAVPYAQMFTDIDAQIQAGNPPDVFRVPYYTFGSYAGRGQLLDLTPHLSSSFSDQFTPAAWAAVQNKGKPYGVPHHTDTSAIFYNKAMLASAGITAVPTKLEQAWTWAQLSQVATTLRTKLSADKFPFAYNWQGNGVTRWLNLLFQAGGSFLGPDQTTPTINSPAGQATVDFSKSFFAHKWVPANDSVKSTSLAADIFSAQTSAMVWSGAFAIPDTAKLDFEWGATFAPRKARGGSDFGGNALVATAKTPRAELAAKFLSYVTEQDVMRSFCSGASLLPTRRDLTSSGIDFAVRPELSPVFLGQASTVRAQDAAQVASPSMSKIITVLKDQLERAFVGGQDSASTVRNISAGIAAATK